MPWNKSSNTDPELNPWKNKNKNFLIKLKFIFLNFLKYISDCLMVIRNKFHYFQKIAICNKFTFSSYFFVFFILFTWFINGFHVIKSGQKGIVTNFGRFSYILYPGVYWKPKFITEVKVVNIGSLHTLLSSGTLFTVENNVIKMFMKLKYKISDPIHFCFSTVNTKDVIQQISDSTLNRYSGHIMIRDIFNDNLELVNKNIKNKIQRISDYYQLGIKVLDVQFIKIYVPRLMVHDWKDVLLAKKQKAKYIQNSENYATRVLYIAHQNEKRILQELFSYKIRKIFEIKDTNDYIF